MAIPIELQYMIVSFTPQSTLKQVCKDWNDEIEKIHKAASNTIGKWYPNVCKDYTTIEEMVRYYVIYYKDELFIQHPEYAIYRLYMNPILLSVLPPIEDRKRSNVRDWILNMPITLDEWSFVGW
jgi:hypothetical protein